MSPLAGYGCDYSFTPAKKNAEHGSSIKLVGCPLHAVRPGIFYKQEEVFVFDLGPAWVPTCDVSDRLS